MGRLMHHDFWFEPAKLYRVATSGRRTHLLTGSVNALIDAALADESGTILMIESDSGGMLVDREIVRAACDLTRPRRLLPTDSGWYGGRLRLIDGELPSGSEGLVARAADDGDGLPITILVDRDHAEDEQALIAAADEHIRAHGLPADRVVRLSGTDFPA
ncbi:hypothetical protein GGQ80_000906 [Sphingomonas jinjuensis]|uniref:Uncharacterized protein n=1 Tax=Sphingomonas jinjuensis TaxID=535907 RepID=A0A840FG96_9SPHN|nr:hypothetical protein [Sphingomonas jinjuensis]MBB4153018.1 hypothetical protein [Sphingomonas jinjuensis]